jgi:hypothetical protein
MTARKRLIWDRPKNSPNPIKRFTLHIIKSHGREKGKLAFEVVPAFSEFTEVAPASTSHA